MTIVTKNSESNKVDIIKTDRKKEKTKALKVKFKDGKELTILMKGALSELFYRALNVLYAKNSDYANTYSLEMNQENQMNEEKSNQITADGVDNSTTVCVDGKEYKINGQLEEILRSVLKSINSQSVSTESQDDNKPTVYCVRIDQVEQEQVDEFAGMISNTKLVLFAINPGKTRRSTSMEALERLAEENDVSIYHDLDALDYFIHSKETEYEFIGPISDLVIKVFGDKEPEAEETETKDEEEVQDQ